MNIASRHPQAGITYRGTEIGLWLKKPAIVLADSKAPWSVRIGDTDFPIKQVLSAATGMPGAAFISTDAYRILTHLGFDLKVEQL
jgi:hypothetical protein